MAKREVLFVCTGNVCRSPMAEYLLRNCLGSRSPWRVSSAGVSAASGLPASEPAVLALRERGMDLTRHRSRPVTRFLVDDAAVIVLMTSAHREQVRARFPDVVGKMFLLRSFAPDSESGDIHDPIGSSVNVYRAICEEIDAAIPGLAAFLECLHVS